MSVTKITTGQYVNLNLPLASVGSRILAQLIDVFVIITIDVVLATIISEIFDNIVLGPYFKPFLFLAITLFTSFYYLCCEYFLGGQTFGKMALRIKVTTLDGTKPSLGSLILRWIFFPLDTFLSSFLGIIFIIFTDKHQRIGDLAAGTTVVKLKGFDRTLLRISDFEKVPLNYSPMYPEAANLNMKQADVIRTALYYNERNREYYIDLAAQKVQEFLKTDINTNINSEQYLNIVLQDYKYYAAGGL